MSSLSPLHAAHGSGSSHSPSLLILSKRSQRYRTEGTIVDASSSYACTDGSCCSGSSFGGTYNPSEPYRYGNVQNTTHWFGYGVDEPTPYQNITGTGGIVVNRPNGTLFVAHCGTAIGVDEYVYQGAAQRRGAGVKWGGLVGAVLALALGVGHFA